MPTPVSTQSLSPQGYSYEYKPGGVNYYRDGQPISREQYTLGTGKDYRTIEQAMPQWASLGYADQASYLADTKGGEPALANATNPGGSPITLGSIQDTSGGATGSATTTTTNNGTKTLPDGRTFNLNDPTQRLAYFNALKDILTVQRDQALTQAQEAFKSNDAQTVAQYQQYLTTLDQNLSDVDAAAKAWTNDYLKTVDQFNQGKATGDSSRQGYFASISPNAFQSSQATSQGYANDQYNQGLTDLANQAQSTVGLNYLNAYNPQSQDSLIGNLDAGSQFGRNASSVTQQRGNMEQAFNAYRTGAANTLQQQQSTIGQNYLDALNNNSASLGQIDLQQGKNPFQYGLQSVSPYKAQAVDMSQYTPYTNFQSLSTNQPGTTGSYQKPIQSSNAYSQPTLDAWLGRTKTQLPTAQKNDWFNKYMLGKAQ